MELVFILMERVPGERPNEVWSRIFHDHRKDVAAQIAMYTVSLAKLISSWGQGASGVGIFNAMGLISGEFSAPVPSWKLYFHPRLTAEEFTALLIKHRGEAPPAVGRDFFFYHRNMGTTNIFVFIPHEGEERVSLTAIIDWLDAGCFPRRSISTKPRVSRAFGVNTEFIDEPPEDE